MSSHKVFDDGLHNDILNTGIIEYNSVLILNVAKCTSFCGKIKFGFTNDDCAGNKLLFLNPVLHFAKFQKFFSKEDVNKVKQLIDELK